MENSKGPTPDKKEVLKKVGGNLGVTILQSEA